jgi:hypothetical protein
VDRGWVGERVAIDYEDVGVVTGAKVAFSVAEAERGSGACGARMQRLGG